MRKSIHLIGCSAFLAAFFLGALPLEAAGVPGAPVGGPTSTGGNGGVGDYDAGTDRSQSYDQPSTGSAMSNTTTGNDSHHRHHTNPDTPANGVISSGGNTAPENPGTGTSDGNNH